MDRETIEQDHSKHEPFMFDLNQYHIQKRATKLLLRTHAFLKDSEVVCDECAIILN